MRIYWDIPILLIAGSIIKNTVVIDENNAFALLFAVILYYIAGYIHCKAVED